MKKITGLVVLATVLGYPLLGWSGEVSVGCRTPSFCNWADLKGKSYEGKDITEMSFEAADMTGVNLKNAKADHVVFHITRLDGADLSGADLAGATFFSGSASKASFRGANLKGVNFTRTNLSGANLKDARIDNSTVFIHANLSGTTWVDGRVCAEGSDGVCK